MWSPLQHTAKRCNTLQHAATHCNTLQHTATHMLHVMRHIWRCPMYDVISAMCCLYVFHSNMLQRVAACCSVLPRVAACCSVSRKAKSLLQSKFFLCVAVCCSVLQCVAVCCSVLPRVAACCSVLQASPRSHPKL